jgi:hypothetical protein
VARLVRPFVPPLLALVVGVGFLYARFSALAGRALGWADFNRRDSGQYLSIAGRGYWARTAPCRSRHHVPVHLCGNVTWFPGYPALTRGVSELTRAGLPYAAIAVSWACWFVVLVQVWRLSDGSGAARRWLCLALAVFFPGQVYFGTIFPLSLAAGAALLSIEAAAVRDSRRWALPAGFVAGTSYLAMALVAPALVIGAVFAARWRARATLMSAAVAVAAGVGAVLLYAQLTVSHWNAYFITEKEDYGVELQWPWGNLVHHLRPVWAHVVSTTGAKPAAQTVLLMVILLVALVVTVMAWAKERVLVPVDVALLFAAVATWLLPYLGGGDLSVYRAEGCVVLVVPLMRRAPSWLLVPLTVASVVVAYQMSGLFWRNILG